MTTYYALPGLTNWSTAGGWSNTSGGASNGSTPNNTIDVVFDANSGISRSIVAGVCRSINTSASAAMTFTGTLNTLAGGGAFTNNLTGTASVATLTLGTVNGFSTTYTLIAPNVPITTLNIGTSVTLGSNISVSGNVIPNVAYQSDGTTEQGWTFDAVTYNVTLSALSSSSAGNGATVTWKLGSGTWTFTGANTLFGASGISYTAATGCTMKTTDASATAKALTLPNTTTAIAVWVSGAGTGVLTLTVPSTGAASVRIDPGCIVSCPTGTTGLVAASYQVVGTPASPITIQSATSGTRANLTKTGGGTVYLDFCKIKDINGSPSATFTARSSTNLGNNANITFLKALPTFLSFF